jgi:hypothetical protein
VAPHRVGQEQDRVVDAPADLAAREVDADDVAVVVALARHVQVVEAHALLGQARR